MNVDAVFRRDRGIVIAALAAITILAWTHLYAMSPSLAILTDGAFCVTPMVAAWSMSDALIAFFMWNVMMVGMMIPTASPMILMFSTTNRRLRSGEGSLVPTAVFVLGYLLVWSGYSALAVVAQWALHSASLLSPLWLRTTPAIGGLLFITAGVFQWTPWKYACLSHCRTPLSFLMTEWRDGRRGALVMGLKHGAYCAGCCWAIMALMFVAGAMNLLWTAVLAVFMLVEKVAPGGVIIGRTAGVIFIVAGVWMLLAGM